MPASKMFKNMALCAVAALLVTGCSWLEDWPPGESHARAPYPEEIRVSHNNGQNQQSSYVQQVSHTQDMTAPPNQMLAMAPAGVNVDVEGRIRALEEAVTTIRNDITTMMPALKRLTAVQTDISEALGALQPAAGTPDVNDRYDDRLTPPPQTSYSESVNGNARPQALAPMVSSSSQYNDGTDRVTPPQRVANYDPAPRATPPVRAPSGYGPDVRGVRFGEHPYKTRLVFDMTEAAPFSYTLHQEQNLLVLDLPGVSWGAQSGSIVADSPLVDSYSAYDNGQGGTRVEVVLKRNAEVAWADSLPGNDNGGARLVLDLAHL